MAFGERVSGDDVEWDEQRLRFELVKLISEAKTHPTDVFRKFDFDGDGLLSRKELLKGVKALVVDEGDANSEELWYSTVRTAVKAAFDVLMKREEERRERDRIRFGGVSGSQHDATLIEYIQFIKWLDPKDSLFTESKHNRMLTSAEKRAKDLDASDKPKSASSALKRQISNAFDGKVSPSGRSDDPSGTSPKVSADVGERKADARPGAKRSLTLSIEEHTGQVAAHRTAPSAPLHASRYPRWMERELQAWRNSDKDSPGARRLAAFKRYEFEKGTRRKAAASADLYAQAWRPSSTDPGPITYPPAWRASPSGSLIPNGVQQVAVQRTAWGSTICSAAIASPEPAVSTSARRRTVRHQRGTRSPPPAPTVIAQSPNDGAAPFTPSHREQNGTLPCTPCPPKGSPFRQPASLNAYSPPPPANWVVEEYAAANVPPTQQGGSDATSGAPAQLYLRTFPFDWEAALQSPRVTPRFRRLVVRPPPPVPSAHESTAARFASSPYRVKTTAVSVSLEPTRQIGLSLRTGPGPFGSRSAFRGVV